MNANRACFNSVASSPRRRASSVAMRLASELDDSTQHDLVKQRFMLQADANRRIRAAVANPVLPWTVIYRAGQDYHV